MWVALPALIGSLLTIDDFLGRLVSDLVGAGMIVQALVPVAIVGVCCVIVSSRTSRATPGFASSAVEHTYHYATVYRRTAKWVLFPVVLLAAWKIWAAVPNVLLGEEYVVGHLCAPDGEPIRGRVEAVDRFGNVVSRAAASTDDAGFFVVDLRRWSTRAEALRFTGQQCQPQSLLIRRLAADGPGCGTASAGAPSVPTHAVWIVACP